MFKKCYHIDSSDIPGIDADEIFGESCNWERANGATEELEWMPEEIQNAVKAMPDYPSDATIYVVFSW